jgi:isoquinoline 1-oxidoreductase subunit alpha
VTALIVNGQRHALGDVAPETPLLWVLRDRLNLVGTKFGCGVAQCGACTVHVDGRPIRACMVRTADVVGRSITTIEGLAQGLAEGGGDLHPLQQAWIELDVPQCGYCQAGQIMSAAALLAETPQPSDAEIDEALAGNICRCGTQIRIRQAVQQAAARLAARNGGGA